MDNLGPPPPPDQPPPPPPGQLERAYANDELFVPPPMTQQTLEDILKLLPNMTFDEFENIFNNNQIVNVRAEDLRTIYDDVRNNPTQLTQI
jgi:hypothetical protein